MSEGRAVLAASTGGHLAQMARLLPDLPIDADPLWITFDHPQSRSLLEGKRVVYVPYIAPRDFKGVAKGMPTVIKALKDERCDIAISTGAAIALPVLTTARMMGKQAWYIESVSRFDGPSLTGKAMASVPGIKTFTQHEAWANDRWKYRVSVLDKYESRVEERQQVSSVFVTLGTIKPYRFDALVDAIMKMISSMPRTPRVIWQLGATSRSDLPGEVHDLLSASEFDEAVLSSDVCISHSGVGSAMQVMDLGRAPLLVPRRVVRNEHVDDHQQQIARELSKRGLAIAAEVDGLDSTALLAAASRTIERVA